MSVLRTQKRKKTTNNSVAFKITKPILIVEESLPLAKLLAVMLEQKWDCEVHVAHSYEDAQSYLKKFQKDYYLAVCDIDLPDAQDGEIVDLLNKTKVKFIAISDNADSSHIKTILKQGAIDFIDKNNINAYPYATELVGRIYRNRNTKILIADNSKKDLQTLEAMLQKLNFQVLLAHNGEDVLELLEQLPDIRIIITSFNLSDMDGIQLTIKIRRHHSKDKISIIGVSGAEDEMIASNFIKNGANDFIVKPFQYNELLCRITQNLEMLEQFDQIKSIANHDFMTKVYNRRYFFTEGTKIYNSAKNSQKPLTVCLMDIDHFKRVNDTYGHDCGDIVLIRFAKHLSEHFDTYLFARLGGEEFAVLLYELDYQKALQLMKKFCLDIEHSAVECGDISIKYTVSIGATCNYAENIDAMLKIADKNLYQVKQNGRNGVLGD